MIEMLKELLNDAKTAAFWAGAASTVALVAVGAAIGMVLAAALQAVF